MISAARVIYAEAYEGTDIISHFAEIYHAAKPYIMLRQQYIILTSLCAKHKTSRCRQALLHIGVNRFFTYNARNIEPSYESKAVFLFIFRQLPEIWIFRGDLEMGVEGCLCN